MLDGWPERKEDVPEEIRPYWDFREEIRVAEELPFKGNYSKSTAVRNADNDTHVTKV